MRHKQFYNLKKKIEINIEKMITINIQRIWMLNYERSQYFCMFCVISFNGNTVKGYLAKITRKLIYFFLAGAFVDWNTDDALIRFSIYLWKKCKICISDQSTPWWHYTRNIDFTYCSNTWFSDRSLRFSSLTLSTRCDKSRNNKTKL